MTEKELTSNGKRKLMQAFQVVYEKTGKREATKKELMDAFRQINPLLAKRSDDLIGKMLKMHCVELQENDVVKPQKGD